MQTNILEYLEFTVKQSPDKIAFGDETDTMSFSELYEAAKALGSGLISKKIYKSPVIVYMDKKPSTIAAFLGVVYSGNFYICVSPEMPLKRIELIIKQTNARIIIADEKNFENAKKISFDGELLCYSDLSKGHIDEDGIACVRKKQLDTDIIYIVFTSGSTGVPKGVAACHRSVIDYTESLSDALGFSCDTVFANQTPLYFDAPLKEIMPTLKFGATTYFVPKKYFMFPIMLVDFLNKYKINTICWVVSALTMISSLGVFDKKIPQYLKVVAFGSEVFPLRQFSIWKNALPDVRFFNLYGPTEATGMSCFWENTRELEEGEPIPIGRPFKNTEILLIKEDKTRAADGEEGEIYIRGTCVTLGYYNDSEKTEKLFVQNPLNSSYPEIVYRTGDIARINSYGELVFVSRRDYQIKHMGHRIELGEIESTASDFDKIYRAAVIYDSEKDRLMLYYTGVCGEDELSAYLKEYLPKYMLPTSVKKLEAMPLTSNGKLDRRALSSFQ